MPEYACGILPDQDRDGGAVARDPGWDLSAAGVIDVSVCIVNWNCRDMLRACLRSLLEQPQGARLEVILVDNASSDGAAAMVAAEFPQVKLLRNASNAGFARANNQAAGLSRGRFLFFLNNDTVVPLRTLGKLVAYLQSHPEAVILGPGLRDGGGKVQMSYRRRPTVATFLHRTLLLGWTGLFRRIYRTYRREALVPADPGAGHAVEVLMGAAMLLRRDDFLRLGGWDEVFTFGGEDLDLCRRACQLGLVVYLPEVEITHFGRASTRQHVAYASTRIAVGFVQYLRKSGASRAALLAYKLAITLDAPLQFVVKGGQYLFRRLCGKEKEAEQSLTGVRAVAAFFGKGLVGFWRA